MPVSCDDHHVCSVCALVVSPAVRIFREIHITDGIVSLSRFPRPLCIGAIKGSANYAGFRPVDDVACIIGRARVVRVRARTIGFNVITTNSIVSVIDRVRSANRRLGRPIPMVTVIVDTATTKLRRPGIGIAGGIITVLAVPDEIIGTAASATGSQGIAIAKTITIGVGMPDRAANSIVIINNPIAVVVDGITNLGLGRALAHKIITN